FWHKLLYDYNYVSTPEPFHKLFHQGLILGADGRKMSKSLNNVINPDQVVADYGADALRLFEMFLGPLEQSKPWSETGIEGISRFLNKIWRLYIGENGELSLNIQDIQMNKEQEYHLHKTIKKVSEDIEHLRFNTAISQMMIFINEYSKYDIFPLQAAINFIKCLAPFAPHFAEEIWSKLGNCDSIFFSNFPEYIEEKTILDEIEIVIQVNSKIRQKLTVPLNATQEEIYSIAIQEENVQKYIEGKQIKKVIFVPNKLLNIIV
ncbi:MAG TPA: class I tRNA ligase family protein, partial [Bacteroidota bacterium]|nr:class I tRNA ligase family protein [Bacteroidota bacterium]